MKTLIDYVQSDPRLLTFWLWLKAWLGVNEITSEEKGKWEHLANEWKAREDRVKMISKKLKIIHTGDIDYHMMRPLTIHEQCVPCNMDGMTQPFPINDLEHLAEYLEARGMTAKDFKKVSGKRGTKELVRRLEGLNHTYRTKTREGEPIEAYEATDIQVLRCHTLLDALENPDFVRRIGEVIDRNPKDGKTEVGGLIKHSNRRDGNLELWVIPSATESNRSYGLSRRDQVRIPNITPFHLHAMFDDCTKYAGPSGCNEPFGGEKSDLATVREDSEMMEQSHAVVITKLEGRRFNIDFYSAQMRFFQPTHTIIDLGNYNYETGMPELASEEDIERYRRELPGRVKYWEEKKEKEAKRTEREINRRELKEVQRKYGKNLGRPGKIVAVFPINRPDYDSVAQEGITPEWSTRRSGLRYRTKWNPERPI